ncbi:MAG TPA: lipopolysaccharide heptosyltransferase I [Thermoanaerobaculia bacterium]|nr:lipopolysaccharide heptosyltransferase I [Thermoanaerobaculia bacterium]
MTAPPPARPQRILLVRTSALGDVVHALPVLTALRRHLPEARIGWVVEAAMAPLLAGHPDIDELFVVRLRTWRRAPFAAATRRELGAFRSAVRRFAPDAALDLMGNHKGGAIALLSGAGRRIGLARRARREPSSAVWINESALPRGVHAVDRGLALLDALGLPPEPADFGADRLLPAALAPPALAGEPFALLHPGAAWANKRYPPERWGEAARRLREATGLPTRVAVAPGEEALAAAVEAAAAGAAAAVPAPDLPALVALTRSARLFLGADTGPTHLAHALGTPVVMVMGPTHPERHGPYGAVERALWHPLPCSFCYRRFEEVKACLLDVPPARVAERAAALLADPARC